MGMPYTEWQRRYSRMRAIAERVDRMRTERARKLCKAAGLDPGLLGIHPHNAMCAWNAGQPWKGVNYSLVRQCIRVAESCFQGYRILEQWDNRVRSVPFGWEHT